MTEGNEKKIQDYCEYRLDEERVEETTVKLNRHILTKFAETLDKPFKKATHKDIRKFLNSYADRTKDLYIIVLRRFYRWLFKSDELPECIKGFKLQSKRSRAQQDNDITRKERIVTPEEYEKLQSVTKNPQFKAIFETLYLFGCRISELTSMKATGVDDDGEIVTIDLRDSKTKPRVTGINVRPKYLLDWYNTYQPYKGQKDKPLWVSKKGTLINKGVVNSELMRFSDKAEIGRNISPHDFRHTAITRALDKGMPTTHVEELYGFETGSAVISVYDHNDQKSAMQYLRRAQVKQRPPSYKELKKKADLIEILEQKVATLTEQVDKMTKHETDVQSKTLILKPEDHQELRLYLDTKSWFKEAIKEADKADQKK